jgi:hypothetical protein
MWIAASMLGLLQWRQQNDLAGMLNKFSFVDQNEIVKFLKETFDSLFAILVSPSCQGNTKLSLQVYAPSLGHFALDTTLTLSPSFGYTSSPANSTDTTPL